MYVEFAKYEIDEYMSVGVDYKQVAYEAKHSFFKFT